MVIPAGLGFDEMPSRALFVAEVSVSSRTFDMGVKARRYAAAGYPEYWVVDAARLEVVVHTEPSPDGWQHITTVTEGVLTPAAVPSVEVDLAVLFAGAS